MIGGRGAMVVDFLGKITMVSGALAYFWCPIEFGQKCFVYHMHPIKHKVRFN
jgi:hypothetical protein